MNEPEITKRTLCTVACLYVVACAGLQWTEPGDSTGERWRERQGSVEGWWSERGLVVPHETFPADCTLCHVEGTWTVMRDDFAFDHGAETGYALSGAHAEAQCLRCHNDRGPAAAFVAQGCSGCHVDVHAGQRGTRCEDCHREADWSVAESILAHATTRFPLVGPHAATTCRRCHLNIDGGVVEPLDTACTSCHLGALERANDPEHEPLGWVADCEDCHVVAASWDGMGFAHLAWRLTGAHAATDCTACHDGGEFAGTPRSCFACHADEYDAATDPDHVALGLPTSCDDCHGTTTWQGANFNHPWFPIDSGDHRGFDCADCHVVPGDLTQFSCTHCHDHRQSEMDDEHDDVPGYVWLSSACYQCHPNGQELTTGFDSTVRVKRLPLQKDIGGPERRLDRRR